MDVVIGGINLTEEYGLEWYDISDNPPPVNRSLTPVPGRNGSIDSTEAGGKPITYGDRTVKLFFSRDLRSAEEWRALCSSLCSALHGRRLKIEFGIDPGYFYIGRIEFQTPKQSLITSLYQITAVCDPWKYKKELTRQTITVAGEKTIILRNLMAPAVPTITTAQSGMELVIDRTSIKNIPTGGVQFPEFTLVEGANTVTVRGNGTVLFEWQEGCL